MTRAARNRHERLVTRHRVSLTFALPGYYREKIRAIPGVVSVVPVSWFGGIYKDQKPENFFAQFGTDPDEFFETFRDISMPEDQIKAWQRDRQGVIVDDFLANKYGWKLGDRIVLQGTIYPVNLELNIRGIFTRIRTINPSISIPNMWRRLSRSSRDKPGRLAFWPHLLLT